MIPRFKSPSINSVTSRAYEILNVSRNNYYPGTESLFDAFLLPAHYSLQCRQEQAGWRNRRGSRQFFEGAKDILPKFPQIARNFHLTNFLHTDFLQLLMHFILLYNVAIDLKI